MKPILSSLAWMPSNTSGGNQATLITWPIHPYDEAQWFQHHAVGMFFSGRDWGSSVRIKGKTEQSTESSLMKTCSRALRTSDWGEGSPSNRTTTLSTQTRQRRSGFGTSLLQWSFSGLLQWPTEYPSVAQPEPGLELDRTSLWRTENSCAATLPIQPDRSWEDLQRRMGETPQIQVCQACRHKAVIAATSASTKYWVLRVWILKYKHFFLFHNFLYTCFFLYLFGV